MKSTDVKCPVCGKLNKNVYLDETDGWMECERCKTAVQVMSFSNDSFCGENFRFLVPLSRK